jgi:coproporphyrinogen III oxidase-like Fe-S oxidoreductase
MPHKSFSAAKSAAVVRGVVREIDHRLARQLELSRARVSALYFGVGTANLPPAEPFRMLTRKLAEAFDFADAEVSLDGVPARFVRGHPLLVDVMQKELPARHFRISMGIQTFSELRLEQMGRLGFGRPATFSVAIHVAQQRGMTTSGDLPFNLPAQSLAEMRNDVRRAIDLGLDQICLYHLATSKSRWRNVPPC